MFERVMGDIIDALLIIVAIVTFAVCLLGCAEAPIRTNERPIFPFHVFRSNNGVDAWTADGGQTVLTVYNDTNKNMWIHVKCWPTIPPWDIDYGHHELTTCVPAHGEDRRFVEFMNIDAITQVCNADRWWPARADEKCEQQP